MLVAKWLGIDVTTGELALAVRSLDGQEGYVALPMRGATHWNGDPEYPAFNLEVMPGMLLALLEALEHAGWCFNQGGSLSLACRQHDEVHLGSNGELLMPALSWQCHAAVKEAAQFNADPAVTDVVGRVEPRLILAKLAHVLIVDPTLRSRIKYAMTTGDWLAYMLTGQETLHTSEMQSNALYDQRQGEFAADVVRHVGLDPNWFPPKIASGAVVGPVTTGAVPGLSLSWQRVCEKLAGWPVVAGLGDNHASAVGCGVRDSRNMLASAGTSGTINWVWPDMPPRESAILGFNFYQQCLWLLMHGACGASYQRCLAEFVRDWKDDHTFLNECALQADLAHLQRVAYDDNGEFYRPGFSQLSVPSTVASIQYSIALELVKLVRQMRRAMPVAASVQTFILTGGLSQSPFFQEVFQVGLQLVAPDLTVELSGRTGPLRYKTTAYGALINAEVGSNLGAIPADRFPVVPCASADPRQRARLQPLLEDHLKDTD